MYDETNQMMEGSEVELPENLFEDEGETGVSEGAEPLTPSASEEEGNGSDSENAQSEEASGENGENHAGENDGEGSVIRVKYNGEERDISLDEARTLAQKGLNYDHVVEERDRNRSAFDFLMERAKVEGITVEQLIERERGRAEDQRLEAKKSEIRARDDDASDETIESLARLELEAEKARAERESAKARENKDKEEIESWNRLFREHPELIAPDGSSKVSPGVLELVKSGRTPTEAFLTERNRELEAQSRVAASEQRAKQKSVGSLSGVQSAEEDDFLAGFNGE